MEPKLEIRLIGTPEQVDALAAWLRTQLALQRESRNRPGRTPDRVLRYLILAGAPAPGSPGIEVQAAVDAEREACARIAERVWRAAKEAGQTMREVEPNAARYWNSVAEAAYRIVQEIRARDAQDAVQQLTPKKGP